MLVIMYAVERYIYACMYKHIVKDRICILFLRLLEIGHAGTSEEHAKSNIIHILKSQ